MFLEIQERKFDKYLYRYNGHAYSYGGFTEWGEYKHSHSTYKVQLHEYGVIKETPKGFWIEGDMTQEKRFVRKEGIKKYAAQTKEEALKDFIARRKKQISIFEARLSRAKIELEISEAMTINEVENEKEDLLEILS